MTITQRPYRSNTDLFAIGDVLRRAYAAQHNWNTYSFARFDIWAQRRLADEVLFNKSEWRQDFQLWESNGDLIGAVFFESPSDAAPSQDRQRACHGHDQTASRRGARPESSANARRRAS